MKTLLMLTVGLMLAGCGSMENLFEIMAVPQRPSSPSCRIPATLLRWTRYVLALDD